MDHGPLFGNHLSNGWESRVQWSGQDIELGDTGGGRDVMMWLGDLWTRRIQGEYRSSSLSDRHQTHVNGGHLDGKVQN